MIPLFLGSGAAALLIFVVWLACRVPKANPPLRRCSGDLIHRCGVPTTHAPCPEGCCKLHCRGKNPSDDSGAHDACGWGT